MEEQAARSSVHVEPCLSETMNSSKENSMGLSHGIVTLYLKNKV